MSKPTLRHMPILAGAALLVLPILAGCATNGGGFYAEPAAILPSNQYQLAAQSRDQAIHLRISPKGLSSNQQRALTQVASRASWDQGGAVDVSIVTGNAPEAVRAGYAVKDYLVTHRVPAHVISYTTSEGQPADVVTVGTREYRAMIDDCNSNWENLSATRNNQPYANFGCSLTANMAAQIADPRDIAAPHPADPADAGRKATIIDKYRKGEVTSAAENEAAKSNVSDAIK